MVKKSDEMSIIGRPYKEGAVDLVSPLVQTQVSGMCARALFSTTPTARDGGLPKRAADSTEERANVTRSRWIFQGKEA